MHDVGASWLMTSLAPSPLMVALVQAATSLPMVFLALPAGALADVVDRRRYLIVTQLWMLVTAALLGTCTCPRESTLPAECGHDTIAKCLEPVGFIKRSVPCRSCETSARAQPTYNARSWHDRLFSFR